MPRAALLWLLPRAHDAFLQVPGTRRAVWFRTHPRLGLMQQLPHLTAKQLSAFIAKVETRASLHVGLVYGQACLLMTTVIYPILPLICVSQSSTCPRFRKTIQGIILICAIPVMDGIPGIRSEDQVRPRRVHLWGLHIWWRRWRTDMGITSGGSIWGREEPEAAKSRLEGNGSRLMDQQIQFKGEVHWGIWRDHRKAWRGEQELCRTVRQGVTL